jgi:hypothetical protein
MHVLFKNAVYFITSSHLSSPDLVEGIYCFTNGDSCTEAADWFRPLQECAYNCM